MATKSVTITEIPNAGSSQAFVASWANMANGDDGEPVELPDYADRSVQVEGTFGTGGSCAVQGTNDSANYRALTDPQGVTIGVTAAGIKQVAEMTRKVRPKITAGDGSTSLTVTMFFRRTRK